VTDTLELRSITAYRDLESEFARDGDQSPFTIAHYMDTLEQDQFTQEFQLLGDSFDNRFNWILGLYYFEESGDNVNTLDFTVSRFRSGGKFDNKSYAAFAQGTYDITNELALTLGARYTDETKKFLPDQIIYENKFAGTGHPQLDAPFMQAGERILPFLEKKITIDEFTPYVNLSYTPTDDLMVYASYSEGFKSGGFTQRVFPPIVAGFTAPAGTPDIDLIPTFDPEFVEVYEIGFKYSTPNQKLRLNGAVFHTDYSDLQVQVFTSVAPVTENAASANITGFELEMQATPMDSLFVEAGVGYLDARYSNIDEAETFINPDNAFERVPEWALNAAVSYEIAAADWGYITPRVDWSYKSRVYNDAFNTMALSQPGYHLVNANVAVTNLDETLELIVGVKNLTDKEYLITGVFGDAMQAIEGMFARGREWFVTARVNF
jgi:iron complex outermembrane receptor protein